MFIGALNYDSSVECELCCIVVYMHKYGWLNIATNVTSHNDMKNADYNGHVSLLIILFYMY